MKYLDDVMRQIQEDYDHAYIGVFDDDLLRELVQCWMETPNSDIAWSEYKDELPEDPLSVAEDFQDELQVWVLEEWEAFLKEAGE
jgi:hypothetical protein